MSNACLLVTHGQFIEVRGLREILDACSLATIGVGAVVDFNQIKRARYCVQVTLCSLYRKLVDAVKADGSTLDPWKWLEEKSLSSSMADYWRLGNKSFRDVGNMHLLLCATHDNSVISFPPTVDTLFQISSTAEEADEKIIRHALHCIKVRYSFIELQSIDTDVLILLLAYIAIELVSNNDSFNLYPKFVTPNPTWYNILSLIEHLTIDVCKALPYFYTFTGCDTVSSFNGKDKCTFFDTWMESKKEN